MDRNDPSAAVQKSTASPCTLRRCPPRTHSPARKARPCWSMLRSSRHVSTPRGLTPRSTPTRGDHSPPARAPVSAIILNESQLRRLGITASLSRHSPTAILRLLSAVTNDHKESAPAKALTKRQCPVCRTLSTRKQTGAFRPIAAGDGSSPRPTSPWCISQKFCTTKCSAVRVAAGKALPFPLTLCLSEDRVD